MSYKINLEQLTTSQLRAVFFNLRLARFDNLKNSQILTEIDVALDQINLAFRTFESKTFMPIEAFIPAEAVLASKMSCSCCGLFLCGLLAPELAPTFCW